MVIRRVRPTLRDTIRGTEGRPDHPDGEATLIGTGLEYKTIDLIEVVRDLTPLAKIICKNVSLTLDIQTQAGKILVWPTAPRSSRYS